MEWNVEPPRDLEMELMLFDLSTLLVKTHKSSIIVVCAGAHQMHNIVESEARSPSSITLELMLFFCCLCVCVCDGFMRVFRFSEMTSELVYSITLVITATID